MDNTPTASDNPSTHVQWMWNSSAGPFFNLQSDEWNLYSDVENMIIEEAFTADQTHALLDDYHIDFQQNLQISNTDVKKQRPVKRMVCNSSDIRLREERFLPNPIAPDRPYNDRYGFISPFIKEVVKDLNLTRGNLPSKDETVAQMVVEKAAQGIIEEGKIIGKQFEAEKIAKNLMARETAGMKEVWKCCAFLYSLESFLYKKVNEIMRLIGNEEHEKIWRSKVRTLGPFCLLLWDNPFHSKLIKPGTVLYRGTNLPDHSIAMLKDDCSKDPKPWHSFQAFTSCTRNRSVAETFGNVLFIIKTRLAFIVDLSELSRYPDEKEELLLPGVSFTTDQMEFDKEKDKHLIYLTLQQRHCRTDLTELSPNRTATTQIKENRAGILDRLRDLDYDRYLGYHTGHLDLADLVIDLLSDNRLRHLIDDDLGRDTHDRYLDGVLDDLGVDYYYHGLDRDDVHRFGVDDDWK